MQEGKVLGALSHFSLFFAPFILPVIVWFFTGAGTFSRKEASLAIKIHILPVLLTIAAIIYAGGIGILTNDATVSGAATIPVLIIVGIIDVAVGIYSAYRGIKILVTK